MLKHGALGKWGRCLLHTASESDVGRIEKCYSCAPFVRPEQPLSRTGLSSFAQTAADHAFGDTRF